MSIIKYDYLKAADSLETRYSKAKVPDTKALYLSSNLDTLINVPSGLYSIENLPGEYPWTTATTTGGTVSGSGTYTYSESAQTKTIGASPNTGYYLDGWIVTGGKNCSASGTTLTIGAQSKGNVIATAVFEPNVYTINKSVSPSGAGSVGGDTSYTFSESAQTKTYTMSANTGYTASSLSTTAGSFSGSTLTIPASNMGSITVTGTFTPNTYTINKVVSPSGYGSISGDSSYTFNTSAQTKTFSYSAASGKKFSSWSTTAGSFSGNTLTIPAFTAGDITVTGNFIAYTPGQTGPGGGIVVKINGSLYEAIMPDTSVYCWDPSTSTSRGCNTNTAAYAGVSNTNKCMSALSGTSSTIWYRLAQYRSSTGDNSWFIPSVAEEEAIRTNCGGSSVVAGWFSRYYIWTSDEYPSSPAQYAWYWDDGDTGWYDGYKSGGLRCVFVRSL